MLQGGQRQKQIEVCLYRGERDGGEERSGCQSQPSNIFIRMHIFDIMTDLKRRGR